MKKTILFYFVILFNLSHVDASRSLYVNGFANILGNDIEENDLLDFAVEKNMETLLLYDLHIVHNTYDITNAQTNQILADFIYKAKNDYGILNIGAIAENAFFFENRIDTYNNTRTNPLEKFDIYNLEFEFWNTPLVEDGGYYCTTYLENENLECSVDGAFTYFLDILSEMNILADNNSHEISVEAYVGWPSATQIGNMVGYLDRVLVHAYVSDPNTSFSYSQQRLMDFATAYPNLDVSIIFSSEPDFMQTWLENNSLESAEGIFTDDWEEESGNWIDNIDLIGFTYFAYSFMDNISLPIENTISENKPISIYPNPTLSHINLSFANSSNREIKISNSLGLEIYALESNKEQFSINLENYQNGIYLIEILEEGKRIHSEKLLIVE